MFRTVAYVAALGAAMVGCAASPRSNGPFKSELDLVPLLPAGADPVGVAVSPEGKRYVLDRHSGLYEIGPAGAKRVFSTSELSTRYGLPSDLDLTDVAALGSDRFAVTAENDGFLLDLYGGTFASYFCYLPALPNTSPQTTPAPLTTSQMLQLQGIPVKQRTESVAYSAESSALFAQPQTIRMDTGAVAGSELFVFRSGGGQPIQVVAMPEIGFRAGGMVALDGRRLLLGSGSSIYEMVQTAGQISPPILVIDLEATVQIGGMAGAGDGTLLLLDRAGRRLLEIEIPR